MEKSKAQYALKLLMELRDIYHREGGGNFIIGISGAIDCLSDEDDAGNESWSNACSIYRTMANSKSGFAEIYIDCDSVAQRIEANARLDQIRDELWTLLGY
jgi:hypothetical protein